jgi:catechol-2,3-dioxygenase
VRTTTHAGRLTRGMAVTRLNHAVLYVRDAQRTADFYAEALGFRRVAIGPDGWAGAVFLQAPGSTNDHDLGVFSIGESARPSPAGRGGAVGLYHLAWEVETLDDLDRLSTVLAERGALVGSSDHGTTKSLYAKDPDGIEMEIAWVVPRDLLDDEALAGRKTIRPLDLAAEKERYGATTRGGVGISTPA